MHLILKERKNLGRIEKYSCISFLIFLCLCVLWDVWVWWPGSVTRCRCQLQPGCCRTHGDCSTARCGHRLDDCSCRQHSFLAGYWSYSAPTACSTCSKIWHADTSFSVFSTAHAADSTCSTVLSAEALQFPSPDNANGRSAGHTALSRVTGDCCLTGNLHFSIFFSRLSMAPG